MHRKTEKNKKKNKYQLSLVEPRDGMVLQTELDDYGGKTSGRLSELEDIVNSVDRQRSGLSRSERYHVSAIDMPKQNFLCPEFLAKFQREVP